MRRTLLTSAAGQPASALSPARARPDLVGRWINTRVITRCLGQGGMGTVYEAEHPRLGRKVAIKVLHPEVAADPALVTRFFNEARATFAVAHPGIVEVFDLGMLPEGLPYMVMELLVGESLGQRLARLGSLSIALAIDLGTQAASALGAAHDKGIVHRDLKPDNLVLVADRQGQPRLKVIDFGVAQVRGPACFAPVCTVPGALLGTPAHMSPEQCRGLHQPVDHRTDVYALGVILYQLLCGVPPFVAAGWGDVLVMQMTAAPVPPSRLRPEVPARLDRVVLKALAKDPAGRFANMADLAAALSAIAPPAPALPRRTSTSTRHWQTAGALAAALLAIFAAAAR